MYDMEIFRDSELLELEKQFIILNKDKNRWEPSDHTVYIIRNVIFIWPRTGLHQISPLPPHQKEKENKAETLNYIGKKLLNI